MAIAGRREEEIEVFQIDLEALEHPLLPGGWGDELLELSWRASTTAPAETWQMSGIVGRPLVDVGFGLRFVVHSRA